MWSMLARLGWFGIALLGSIGAVLAVAALDVLTAWVFTQRRRRARFFERAS